MHPRNGIAISNGLMTAGLLPYLAVFGFIVWTSSYRGDAAMNALFMSVLGFGLASFATLAIALPGLVWSRSLAKSSGIDTRGARLLRRAVIIGLFPVPVVLLLSLKP